MEQLHVRRWLGVLIVMLMGMGWVGARPENPPTEELVGKLIEEQAEEDRMIASSIKVVVILSGEAELEKGFVVRDAVHVKFLWTVMEDGRRVRKVEHRTFFWNEKYGWFIFRKVNPRGGEAIEICSEKLGLLEIR